jgi:hypothetical protein
MARLWRNRWLQTQETELSVFQKLQDLQREGAPRKFKYLVKINCILFQYIKSKFCRGNPPVVAPIPICYIQLNLPTYLSTLGLSPQQLAILSDRKTNNVE